MMESEVEARKSKMAFDLDDAIKRVGASAKRSYLWTFSLVLLAAASSILAGILAFLKTDSTVVGVVALIPAMSSLLISSLKLQDRANWFYKKKDALLRLYNELHFELPNPITADAIAELSKKWSEINETMQDDWSTRLALKVEDTQKGLSQRLAKSSG